MNNQKKEKQTYIMSAVVKGHFVEDNFNTYSPKQAWFYFCKKYGFANRDFKILGTIQS